MKAPPPRKPARAKARPLDGSDRAWKRETAGGREEEVTHLGEAVMCGVKTIKEGLWIKPRSLSQLRGL